MIELKTWEERSIFKYKVSIIKGTEIHFGKTDRKWVTGEQYKELLNAFGEGV